MKLLTMADRKRLPPLYTTQNDKDPIAQVKIFNVTALLSMEEIKATTALPIEG